MNYSDDEDYEGEIDGVEDIGIANLTGPRSSSITIVESRIAYCVAIYVGTS